MRKFLRRPPRPSREVTCERCGAKFYTKKSGVTKYCIECKVDVYKENQEIQRRKR